MRSPKHTPPPWLADRKRLFTDLGGEKLLQIARVYLPDTEEGRANLRLVQKAPEMFDLLAAALPLLEDASPGGVVAREVRNVLVAIDPREPELFPAENPFPTEVA